MAAPIVWIHGDALTPQHPALQAYDNPPAIFVWDDALLERYHISLKRIVFMYECLLEMPVTIRRGEVASEVLAFAHAHDATLIATQASPSPRFDAIRTTLEEHYPVEIWDAPPFVPSDKDYDLRRFSRYWRKAETHALKK